MFRNILLAVSLLFAIAKGPAVFQQMMNDNEGENIARNAKFVASKSVTKMRQSKTSGGRVEKLTMGRDGRFYTNTRMNNRQVPVVVDTGATSVAINQTTAKRIGIRVKASDFKYRASTANGVTTMAIANIKEIQIGRVKVRNVRAGILKDSSLNEILLGMTFLRKLKRFEVSGQTLTLVQ